MIKKPQPDLLTEYQTQQEELARKTSTPQGMIDWIKSQSPKPNETWSGCPAFDENGNYTGLRHW